MNPLRAPGAALEEPESEHWRDWRLQQSTMEGEIKMTTRKRAEADCNDILGHVLHRERDYRIIIEKVESQIPPELIAAMMLCGWNAFGMFETVLHELKKAKLPICCPHCIIGCNACGPKRWLL